MPATDLDDSFINYINAKKDADRANLKLKEAEGRLLVLMEEAKRKTIAWSLGKQTFSATYTQRTTMNINEKGLRKALTARVFDRYTAKKLDRKALETAMTLGEVDAMVVAQFVDAEPGKTYLTYRVKEADEESQGS